MPFRLDLSSGSVGARKRTPQGGLVADANLTRTGVFEYKDQDGKVRRELRHPDEVFAPASLATYPTAPVTVDHPGRVGPDNWKTHAVGHVGTSVRRNGDFLSGEVHIQHGDTMQRAEDGELSEISCGYHCDIDPTPGVYQGKPFDVSQRNIRINHVAVGPKGWGRMGPETKMHLDSEAAISGVDIDDAARAYTSKKELARRAAKSEAAHQASAEAEKSPTSEMHTKAAEAHEAAMNAHRAVGSATAGVHMTKMLEHREKAMNSHALELGLQAKEKSGNAITPKLHAAAGEAHLEAAKAHNEARWQTNDPAKASVHERREADHKQQASEHAAEAGGEWDEGKHPRDPNGKFDSAKSTPKSTPYIHGTTTDSHSAISQEAKMDAETKAALDKALADKIQADADLAKAREDAASAKTEGEKAAATAREANARIASLEAQNEVLKRQVDSTRQDGVTAEQKKAEEIAQQVKLEELIGLRSDARMVFATVDDPEGKTWKADGKNADAIRREVIVALEPTVKLDSLDGSGLRGVYEVAIAGKRRTDKARAEALAATTGPRREDGGKSDGDDDEDEEPDAGKARMAMIKRKKDAWKTSKKDRRGGKAAA